MKIRITTDRAGGLDGDVLRRAFDCAVKLDGSNKGAAVTKNDAIGPTDATARFADTISQRVTPFVSPRLVGGRFIRLILRCFIMRVHEALEDLPESTETRVPP